MTARESIKRFDWMGVVLYPLAVILMESFWVYPWLAWIGGWPMWSESRPPLHLISVIVTLVLGLALTRYLADREHWRLAWIRAAIIGSGIIVFALVLRLEYPPPEGTGWFAHIGNLFAELVGNPSTFILGLAALIYLWWRGINLGGTTSYFRDIYRSFILGMAALIVLLIVWQITAGSDNFSAPGAGIGWNVIAFFFFGLLAIAVCHLYNMRATMAKEDAAQTSVWRWLSLMLGVIGGMVLVGFGLAAAFSPEFFDTLGGAMRGIGWFSARSSTSSPSRSTMSSRPYSGSSSSSSACSGTNSRGRKGPQHDPGRYLRAGGDDRDTGGGGRGHQVVHHHSSHRRCRLLPGTGGHPVHQQEAAGRRG
jgi:hypothetical protein